MNIYELEQWAKDATIGPWEAVDHVGDLEELIAEVGTFCIVNAPRIVTGSPEVDAEYIAAANPQTILELIEHYRSLEAENQRLIERLQNAEEAMRQASDDLYHGPIGQPYESERMIDSYFDKWGDQ